jgi:hypothetical protein
VEFVRTTEPEAPFREGEPRLRRGKGQSDTNREELARQCRKAATALGILCCRVTLGKNRKASPLLLLAALDDAKIFK